MGCDPSHWRAYFSRWVGQPPTSMIIYYDNRIYNPSHWLILFHFSRLLKPPTSIIYTLWLFNIAMQNGPFIDVFPIKTSIYEGFSMAMLNNQRVCIYIYIALGFWQPSRSGGSILVSDRGNPPHLEMAGMVGWSWPARNRVSLLAEIIILY